MNARTRPLRRLWAGVVVGIWLSVASQCGTGAGGSHNLAPNPSAEQIDASGKPVGWGHYENTPDAWGATEKEFHTGKRCAFLKITGFGDDGYACTGLAVGRTDGYKGPEAIPVKPNSTYHFSCYIAGYGFKRKIAVQPWGFKADGSGRDRSLQGISVLPTPEWKRCVGSFTTKAGTGRLALMFFVYALEERDAHEGATLYVDDVYIGTTEPPAAIPATGRKRVNLPRRPPQVMGEGYSELKERTVRIWDANKNYTMKHYDMRAWKDRANWSQVPHGVTDYQFRGDCILEGENFWVSLHSSRYDSVFLYAKTDDQATPGRHNELYRVFDTPTGLRNYGSGSQLCRILKNTPQEAIVYSEAITYQRGGFKTTVTTTYRILGGKPWLEIRPVKQADEQGMHGESRFVLAPEGNEDGSDFADDSLKRPGDYVCRVPNRAKMLLDLIMDDDTIWLLTAGEVGKGTRLNWPGTRFYAVNAPGGWHAGWSRLGEGECDRVWTAPFALFAGQPVYIGVFRIGYWHYQRVAQKVRKGEPVTLRWRVAYTRQITSSPFKPGGSWHPLYPGKWRLVTRINGRYYTIPVTIAAEETPSTTLTFDSPATGNLEYVIFYLYDRTEETPERLWTPMDVYRETIEGESKEKGQRP